MPEGWPRCPRMTISPLLKIVAFVFLCFGLLDVSGTAREIYFGRQSAGWPSVEGKIAKSAVQTARSMGGGGRRSYRGGRRISLAAAPDVIYQYSVDKIPYSGRIVRFGLRLNQGWIKKEYPVGKAVKVFYHPQRPSRAVLQPGIVWRDLAYSFLLEAFLLLVAIMLYALSRQYD